ncbi:MAG: heparinase II/III family protein [Candidatus Brocadiia bacterium]
MSKLIRTLVCTFAALVLLSSVACGASGAASGHPYLFFSRDDVPALRARMQEEPFRTRWAQTLEYADSCLERGTPSPDRVRRNSRNSLGVAGTTAFAYVVTGERRYGERAIEELEALLAAPAWNDPRPGNQGTDLSVAELSVAGALVYDWCYDLMAPEQRRRVSAALVEKGLEPYFTSLTEPHDWWVNNPVTNWTGVCNGGGGLLGLALYRESPRARQAAKAGWERTQKFLRSVILKDGGGHEGVMYWRYGVGFGCYVATAGTRFYGDDEGLFQTFVEKLAGYWDIYMQGPDMKYANFNNMNENTFDGLYGGETRTFQGGPRACMCALFESKVPGGDRLLLWGADNGADKFYWNDTSPFWFLWRREAPPAGPKPELQDVVLFRGAGHAILSSPRLWMAYNGGWTSNKSHNNRDLGTFVLVAGEERFVNDPGYGASDTADHSTVLINGQGQPRDVRGDYRRFGKARGFAYFASDLSDCYPDTDMRRFVRHVVLVRGRYLVMLDDLGADGEAEFEWRLQSRKTPGETDAPRSVKLEGDEHDLHVIPASPADALIAVNRQQIRTRHGSPPFSTVTVRPGSARDETVLVTVLYPTEKGGPVPAVSAEQGGVLRVRSPEGEDVIVFARVEEGWTLHSVNGEDASVIGTGEERSLVPFR